MGTYSQSEALLVLGVRGFSSRGRQGLPRFGLARGLLGGVFPCRGRHLPPPSSSSAPPAPVPLRVFFLGLGGSVPSPAGSSGDSSGSPRSGPEHGSWLPQEAPRPPVRPCRFRPPLVPPRSSSCGRGRRASLCASSSSGRPARPFRPWLTASASGSSASGSSGSRSSASGSSSSSSSSSSGSSSSAVLAGGRRRRGRRCGAWASPPRSRR